MTLQSYLSSGAVDDVRTLLKRRAKHPDQPWEVGDAGRKGKFGHWWLQPNENTVRVSLNFTPPDGCNLSGSEVRCYYRQVGDFYVVTDFGQTVVETAQKLGETNWDRALLLVRDAVGDRDLMDPEEGACIHGRWDEADLPAAIVSVLGAIAKVRSALDKEQGR